MKLKISVVLLFSTFFLFTYSQLSCKLFKKMNEIIKLPEPKIKGEISLEEAINLRHSVRSFKKEELSLEEISQILWAAYGKRIDAKTRASYTVPSAGAIYPMVIFWVDEKGCWRYEPDKHLLILQKKGDLRDELERACLYQDFVKNCGGNVVITVIWNKITSSYGKRGIQYAIQESGHIAQNIHLQTVSLGLGSVAVGAFKEEEVKKILSLKKEHPLYIIPVGKPK